jgi:hypothetical protein
MHQQEVDRISERIGRGLRHGRDRRHRKEAQKISREHRPSLAQRVAGAKVSLGKAACGQRCVGQVSPLGAA